MSLVRGGLDDILVTGDSYIDSPYVGVAVIGKVLVKAGDDPRTIRGLFPKVCPKLAVDH